MKKFLLIFPPHYWSTIPQLGIHILIAQLRKNGYNVSFLDFNKLFLLNYIKEFNQTDNLELLKNKQFPINNMSYDNISKFIFSKENYYLDYSKKLVYYLKEQKYDYIGISIGLDSQLIAGLTIAALLKQESFAHINIGGNYITRINDNLTKYPIFFDTFADSISYGEGEISIIELAKYIENKISIEQVPNLIYKRENKIIKNKIAKFAKLSEIEIPDYSDIDLYFYSDTLPLTVNRGCYWKKCTFCDMSYSLPFNVKKINKVIEEIKFYNEKYKINKFYIVDEAVIPEYLNKLCDAIIKEKLNIQINLCMRFERISKELLQKAYKAGIRAIYWGLESANCRILKLMNKGINIEDVKNILKYSSEAKIKNILFIFFNFPTETYQEAMDTLIFLQKNSKYINYFAAADFSLGRYSKIALNPQKYNIQICEEQKDFLPTLTFKVNNTYKSEKEKQNLEKELNKTINKINTKNKELNTIFFV